MSRKSIELAILLEKESESIPLDWIEKTKKMPIDLDVYIKEVTMSYDEYLKRITDVGFLNGEPLVVLRASKNIYWIAKVISIKSQ